MDEKKIQDFYDNIQFPVPTLEDIKAATEKVEDMVITPAMRRNLKRGVYKKEESVFWDKVGYGELHRWRCDSGKDTDWPIVGKLLNHPLMRVALDACTISGFDDEKIIVMLSQVYKINLSQEAVDRYRKFFGNFRDFDRNSWRKYLERIVNDNYVYTRIFAALTRPRDEVLHLCGLPSENAFSDFLKNVLATSAYKFNHYSKRNSPEADAEARKWAKVGFESGEKFEKFGAADASDFAKLVQTEFIYATSEFPTIDANIAAQIRPQIEAKKDELK